MILKKDYTFSPTDELRRRLSTDPILIFRIVQNPLTTIWKLLSRLGDSTRHFEWLAVIQPCQQLLNLLKLESHFLISKKTLCKVVLFLLGRPYTKSDGHIQMSHGQNIHVDLTLHQIPRHFDLVRTKGGSHKR